MAESPAASDKPVLQKLLYKPGMRAMVLNAPQSYQQVLQEIPGVTQQLGDGPFEFIHVFATERAEVTQDGRKWRGAQARRGDLGVVSEGQGRADRSQSGQSADRVADGWPGSDRAGRDRRRVVRAARQTDLNVLRGALVAS